MHRSKSFSSLQSMSQFDCANSPYEIFTQPSPFDVSQWGELPDGAQEFNPEWHQPAEEQGSSQNVEEEDESSEPPPDVQQDANISDIIFTNTAELRTVLATLSDYKAGQLGTHLKNYRGVVVLPLDAVTAIRTPNSNHALNYRCIVFYPHMALDHYVDTLPNLVESINVLYK